MLFIDTGVFDVILITITALVGIFGVAMATEGFIFCKIPWPLRIVSAVGGLTLLIPGIVTDIIGLVLLAGVIVFQYIQSKKNQLAPPRATGLTLSLQPESGRQTKQKQTLTDDIQWSAFLVQL